MKTFIIKHKLQERGKGVGDVLGLREMVRFGGDTNTYIGYFTRCGYKLENRVWS
ncbi:MAG: hypothetical protein LBS62_01080 [Clostridiales bacterium]|nr:hypothetical protein [Clostridiales bacterium]